MVYIICMLEDFVGAILGTGVIATDVAGVSPTVFTMAEVLEINDTRGVPSRYTVTGDNMVV